MRKITMHRNLCRLRDRSNRELCISGCRLRLHNHFDIVCLRESLWMAFVMSEQADYLKLIWYWH